MTASELRSMSYPQLMKLRGNLDSILQEKRAEVKPKIKQQLAKVAQENGFSLEEFLGHKGHKAHSSPKKVLSPRFRNPDDPSLTWTGRGRAPKWYRKDDPSMRIAG